MKFDHSAPVLDFEGKPMKREDESGQLQVLTYKDLAIMALNNVDPQEQMSADQKVRVYQISLKFYRSDKVTLTVEERAFIKERAGKTLTPLAYGRLCEWLEGEELAVVTNAEDDSDGAGHP